MLCDHGCGNPAKFYSKNTKKWRCAKHANYCPAKAAKTGKAIKLALSQIDPVTGQTINELRLAKTRKTRKTKIDLATGLPLDVARAYKAHRTKQTVTENGLSIQQNASLKISNTKKGSAITKQAGIKSNETQKQTIDPATGVTIKELSTRKRLVTMNEIQSNGLTRLENSLRKSKFRGFQIKQFEHFDLYYQGSNELAFLIEQHKIYGDKLDQNVKRASSIWYYDPTRNQDRLYLPDFFIDNTIIEIKSQWTWNNKTNGSIIHRRNIAKLNAAKAAGYDVRLIIDGVDIIWP